MKFLMILLLIPIVAVIEISVVWLSVLLFLDVKDMWVEIKNTWKGSDL